MSDEFALIGHRRRFTSQSERTLGTRAISQGRNAKLHPCDALPILRNRSGSDQVDFDVDVAPRGFGVRTQLVPFIHQRPGRFAVHSRQADVEASLQEVTA